MRSVVVVKSSGKLADWRVNCEVPTLLTEYNVMNWTNPVLKDCLPLKTYQVIKREVSMILRFRQRVLYYLEAVFDALRLALPLGRTTDIGFNMHIRNDAVCAGGTYSCLSR